MKRNFCSKDFEKGRLFNFDFVQKILKREDSLILILMIYNVSYIITFIWFEKITIDCIINYFNL